jgi:DNA segregation ATPase FtsK/SpoIIIE, S-DNA-T family
VRSRSHPAAQLVESSGPNVGRVHDLSLGEHVIGRGGAADVVLDHKDVSRPHARIDVGVDGVLVRDLDSKNGVFVDGQGISEPIRLSHGQRFSLGELELTVSHPGSQVSRALAQAGETTVTVSRPRPEPTGERASLVLPLFGIVLFGALVAAMLLL